MSYTQRLDGVRRAAAEDRSIDALAPAARQVLGRLWAFSAAGERATAGSFALVQRDLEQARAEPIVIEMARVAQDEERFHADLCALVAHRYLDVEPQIPERRSHALEFETCAPERAGLLRVVLTAAIGESVAAVYLLAALREATSPLARKALRELERDEVAHARLGWAHLGSARVAARERAALALEVPSLIALVVGAWDRDPATGPYPNGHGYLQHDEKMRAVREAVDSIVLPGFAAVGIAAKGAM